MNESNLPNTKDTKPYWYKLVNEVRRELGYANGLSIPFLIGAYRCLHYDLGNNNECILNLLHEIANSHTPQKASLDFCKMVDNGYIISFSCNNGSENFMNNYYTKGVIFNNQLFISDDCVEELGTNITEIANSLTKKYNKCIEAENYSWQSVYYTWERFNDNEIELIKNCYSNNC